MQFRRKSELIGLNPGRTIVYLNLDLGLIIVTDLLIIIILHLLHFSKAFFGGGAVILK